MDGAPGHRGIQPVDGGRVAEQVDEHVHQPIPVGERGVGEHSPDALGGDRPNGVHGQPGLEVEVGGERGRDRVPHVGFAVRHAGAFQHCGARMLPEAANHFVHQPALPHTAFAGDVQRQRALLPQRHLHGSLGHSQLGVAADDRHIAAAPAPRARGCGGLHGQPGGHRLLAALGLQFARGGVLHGVRRERVGGAADVHPARRRRGLQPLGRVHHIAHGGVVGAGKGADQHLTGVDAHPDANAVAAHQAGGCGVRGQGLLHAQGGAHRPLRVVLVRHGGAEEHEHAVAEQLVHPPTELADDLHQTLETRIHQAFHLLGVHVLAEGGEADEVGEEHGDDAPFLRLLLGHGRAARRAEPGPRRNRRTADLAQHQPGSVGHIRLQTDAPFMECH